MESNELSMRPIRINGAIYFGLMFGIMFGFSIEFYGEFFFELRSIFFFWAKLRLVLCLNHVHYRKNMMVFWHASHGLGLFDFFTCDISDIISEFF